MDDIREWAHPCIPVNPHVIYTSYAGSCSALCRLMQCHAMNPKVSDPSEPEGTGSKLEHDRNTPEAVGSTGSKPIYAIFKDIQGLSEQICVIPDDGPCKPQPYAWWLSAASHAAAGQCQGRQVKPRKACMHLDRESAQGLR